MGLLAALVLVSGCAFGYGDGEETTDEPDPPNGYDLKSPSSQVIGPRPTPAQPSPADAFSPPSRGGNAVRPTPRPQ